MLQHDLAHWIAGIAELLLGARRKVGDRRKRRADPADAHCKGAICPSHDGVLLVDERRNPEPRGGKHRRKGRVSAEARKGCRAKMAKELRCRPESPPQPQQPQWQEMRSAQR